MILFFKSAFLLPASISFNKFCFIYMCQMTDFNQYLFIIHTMANSFLPAIYKADLPTLRVSRYFPEFV